MIETTAPGPGERPEPRMGSGGPTVASVVDAVYVRGLAAAPDLGLSEQEAREAVELCAARGCDALGARCRTCRLWSQEEGIETLDAYCSRFGEIRLLDSGRRLVGSAAAGPVLECPSLEHLARTWGGEEYWYLARRILRRLRHKQDRGEKLELQRQAAPTIILVGPQMADNIGMVARAMANFSLEELRLVAPRDGWPNEKARFAASGAHVVIDEAQSYATTPEAVADLHWVCATTARPRHLAKPVLTPDEAMAEMARRIERGERCGVLFGPERTGLTSDDVANAEAVVMARVNPRFASLNLAQAVLLMGYEWMRQSGVGRIGRHTSYEGVERSGLELGSPPATKGELEALFRHIEEELERAGHFKPPEKRPTMLRNMRTMFERMGASAQEVRTLRGIVASLSRGRNRRGEGT